MVLLIDNFFLIYFLKGFNLWCSFLMIAFYHQINTPINFWCRRRLNLGFLIQLSNILPIELTETYYLIDN